MAGENQILDLSMLDNVVIDTIKNTGTPIPKTTDVITSVNPPVVQEPGVITTEGVKVENQKKVDDKPKLELNKGKAEDLVALLDDFDDETSTEDTSGVEGSTSATNTDSPAKSVYEAAAELLIEQGALPELKDVSSIKTPEDFANAVRESLENIKYEGLNETQKLYLKAIETGVPHEVIQSPVDILANLDKVKDSDIQTNAELREILIRTDLEEQGWDEYRINKQIARLKETKEDIEEAMHSKVNLYKNNKKFIEDQQLLVEQQKADAEKERTRQITALKDAVYNESMALGSIKVDGVLKDRVYKTMTEIVGEIDGVPVNALVKDRNSDPVDFEKRLYYAYTITNGFKNLGRLQRAAESNAAKGLKMAIESSGVLSTGSGTGMFNGNTMEMPDIVKID